MLITTDNLCDKNGAPNNTEEWGALLDANIAEFWQIIAIILWNARFSSKLLAAFESLSRTTYRPADGRESDSVLQ